MNTGVILIFVILAACMSIGVPIGVCLGVATAVTMALTTNLNLLTIAQSCFGGLDSFPLMAIPFFILVGNLMKYGGISRRLLDFSASIVGSIRGGLGMVTILSSMFFAAMTCKTWQCMAEIQSYSTSVSQYYKGDKLNPENAV